MTARFTGFGKEAIGFFDELEANNNREWYQAHKDVYERACRVPLEALLAELEPRYGHGKIFRINRDTRFSADKSPYKTHVAAAFPGGYVALSTEGLYVGAGAYMLEPDALARYRDAVADDITGRKLERIASKLDGQGYEFGGHEILKSAPKGYPRDHPRVRFLRHKGIYAGKGFPPAAWLHTRKAYDKVTAVLRDLRPLMTWLDEHVKA